MAGDLFPELFEAWWQAGKKERRFSPVSSVAVLIPGLEPALGCGR